MFNTILNYSRLALVGVATILFVTPLHTLPNNGSPYKYPDGDQDGDRIINKDDICPFSHYSNSKHKWELEKHGVVAINYDQLIEFISDGIDWDAEFHRHDSWIDNTGGQIGNVASVIYMVVLLQKPKTLPTDYFGYQELPTLIFVLTLSTTKKKLENWKNQH